MSLFSATLNWFSATIVIIEVYCIYYLIVKQRSRYLVDRTRPGLARWYLFLCAWLSGPFLWVPKTSPQDAVLRYQQNCLYLISTKTWLFSKRRLKWHNNNQDCCYFIWSILFFWRRYFRISSNVFFEDLQQL